MRSVLFAAVFFVSFGFYAKADVLYSFVGAHDFTESTFTIDSPTFLSYSPNDVTPTSGVFRDSSFGGEPFPITDVRFYSDENLAIENAFTGDSFGFDYNIASDGTYVNYYGTLTITGAPAAVVSATPEPSSFALLGTGLVGIAGVIKRRFA